MPLLTLGFGLPLREAVGVSLVCVIMTSSAAAGVYLERHVANLRLGMTLELFTAIGALVGGSIAFLLDERLLVAPVRRPARLRRDHDGSRPRADAASDTDAGRSSGRRPSAGRRPTTARPPVRATATASATSVAGVVGSTGAGVVSALLGIGGGIIKVPAHAPRRWASRCGSRPRRAT